MVTMYNRHFQKNMVIIHPGEFHASSDDIIISTVLGSCVSIVLHDPVLGICGMNHFMLPGTLNRQNLFAEEAGRYGIHAMELLINDMFKRGSLKKNLQAKVFGGGHVIRTITAPIFALKKNDMALNGSVPSSNIRFAFKFLEEENIPLLAHDTGGNYGRKILLFTVSSQVLLKRFTSLESIKTINEELAYMKQLREDSANTPDPTLF